MSASFHRGGWEVRWRDASGRRRGRRFATEDAARAFDEALAEVSPAARRVDTARHGRSGGVYAYRTAEGTRWRFVYRRSDGTQTTRRGFGSERAARDAKRRLIEQVERGELSIDEVRDFMAELAEAVEGGGRAVKTVNNALGTLVVCLNDALKDGLIVSNPALRVQRLPPGHIERDFTCARTRSRAT